MTTLDWCVMAGWLIFLTAYGLWRGRGSSTTNQYLLAGKTMPWYAMGLSIMATQASAVTFISTTGQGYMDGLRFVQFYFGLPIAMVIIVAFFAPRFHRTGVYTAYEYLEQRFDAKVRALVSLLFLVARGLSAGVALYAPSVVLSVILGWPEQMTVLVMGGLVVLYTTTGGIKAVTWADVQQMMVISASLVLAFSIAVWSLPSNVSFGDALEIAGAAGRLNAVVPKFDWNDRYTIFSGLIGGTFLALAYFGCDQSQVQRYLTGKTLTASRISLLFNAVAKIPLQFGILLIGALVFVLFHFSPTPVLFHPLDQRALEANANYAPIKQRFEAAIAARRAAAEAVAATQQGAAEVARYKAAQQQVELVRKEAGAAIGKGNNYNDTNYVFLHYVTNFLPVGVVGLVLGVIFTAAMSAISGEINSLATVTVIDIYRRFLQPTASDAHTLWASRLSTALWGVFAMWFAGFAGRLGSLIEAVNVLGSLFYGGLLGVFVLAFAFRRVGPRGAFWGVIAGEAAIFWCYWNTSISFLWYNVIGAVVTVAVGCLISGIASEEAVPSGSAR